MLSRVKGWSKNDNKFNKGVKNRMFPNFNPLVKNIINFWPIFDQNLKN